MSQILKPKYDTPVQLTFTSLNGLPTDSSNNFVAGASCAVVSNLVNLYDDVLITGLIHMGTTPTQNSQIAFFGWQQTTESQGTAGAPTYPQVDSTDGINGADRASTFYGANVTQQLWSRQSSVRRAKTTTCPDATTGKKHPVNSFLLSEIWPSMPRRWGLWVSHNTGSNLGAACYIEMTGIWYEAV